MAALQALCFTNPKAYLDKVPSGCTHLRHLHTLCAAEGLAPSTKVDDIGCLFSLFDIAINHGLTNIVTEYIREVCSDTSLTSSDPTQAFLLDGECVRQWASRAIDASRLRLRSWLSTPSAFSLLSNISKDAIIREVARLRALLSITSSLAAEEQNAEAALLLQCVRVIDWLTGVVFSTSGPTGRFSSEQEWRYVASQRRGARLEGGGSLFLDGMIASVAQHDVHGLTLPISSTERLLLHLFLSTDKSASDEALHAKLALLTYHLADGGFIAPGALAQGLASYFAIPPKVSFCWMIAAYLDDAQRVGALDTAIDLFQWTDATSVPFEAVGIFAEHQKPDVALRILRQWMSKEDGLTPEQAAVALDIFLTNDLITEAYFLIHTYHQLKDLMHQFLQHSLDCKTLASTVSMFPFDEGEEATLLQWLETQSSSSAQVRGAQVLYYLARGQSEQAKGALEKVPQGTKWKPQLSKVVVAATERTVAEGAPSVVVSDRNAELQEEREEEHDKAVMTQAKRSMPLFFGKASSGGSSYY